MTISEQIDKFLSSTAFGVVGASVDRNKYGNKVLRCYLQNDRNPIPVNPKASSVEGIVAVESVNELPDQAESISVITPPPVTLKVVDQAIDRGIKNIWLQPGAESDEAVRLAEEAGINVIADGSCILVVLGFREQ